MTAVPKFLTGLTQHNFELSEINLRKAQIAVPVFEGDEVKLAILDIEPIYGSDKCQQTASHPYITRFMTRLHESSCKAAESLARPERMFKKGSHDLGNPPKCIAKPKPESVAVAAAIDSAAFMEQRVTDLETWHLGALYAAIHNLGFIIQNGQYCEFPTTFIRWLPPFIITKLREVLPYDNFTMPRMFGGTTKQFG